MAKWSKDHVAAIGSLISNFGLFCRSWLNWRLGGALRWKVETVGWEGRGVVCVKSAPQRLYPCLCQLRTHGLAPVSKYWTYQSHVAIMGPVSWCSFVSSWPKPLFPTPMLSWGRKNEMTQGDDRASLSLAAKTYSGCRDLFCTCGD
jgi:hypothetical protein